jgi:hypothetical protein
MPNLSASEYTTFLKFKAAGASPIKPAIQTRDNVSMSQSVISANVLTSQAALGILGRVRAVQPERTNNPNALSTIAHSTGSVLSQPGGLPAKNRVVYTRLPQIV